MIPVQYQQGYARFMDMDILVDSRALIPRPETEILINVVRDLCQKKKWNRPCVLEVGTGSGVIPIGLVKILRDCKVTATDISPPALDLARENLKRHDCEPRVELVLSDMFSDFCSGYDGAFDCVVSNPPYVSDKDYETLDEWVKAEPKIALYAGFEGMKYLNVIAEESARFLRSGGFVAAEVGYDQAEKVKTKFKACGFIDVAGFQDFNGYERVIVGWKHG